jgi:hypothetical protein
MNITLQGGRQLSARLSSIGPAVRANARKELPIIGEHLATYGREHFEDSGLHVRSGDLRRSMAAMPVEEDSHGLRGGMIAGQGLPYGRIQEEGGTIVPKNGQYLTIPIGEALTSAGVARFAAPDAEAEGYKTFVRNNIIFGVKDGQLFPLFILVTSVTIPARPFVGPTLDANRDWIVERLQKYVVKPSLAGGA